MAAPALGIPIVILNETLGAMLVGVYGDVWCLTRSSDCVLTGLIIGSMWALFLTRLRRTH